MVALASSFTGAFQRGLHFQSAALSALEVPENKTRIPVTLEDGTETIVVPDGIKGQTFIEVKDVKDIYNAKQFRGYFASGNAIQLIVSPNTQTISGPLQALINRSGGSIRVYDPGTGKFTPWGTS
ncbi:putative toxin [Paraburkholderia sediminicola]